MPLPAPKPDPISQDSDDLPTNDADTDAMDADLAALLAGFDDDSGGGDDGDSAATDDDEMDPELAALLAGL